MRENRKEIIVCIFLLLSPIALYIFGVSKIKFFQSINLTKNDYTIRAIGSKIDLNRFYGSTDAHSVVKELIDLSKPNLNTKMIFIWPEGIIPNINQSELKDFEFLFNQKFNENHLIGLGINNYLKTENNENYFNSFSFDHKLNLIKTYNKVNLVPFGEFCL